MLAGCLTNPRRKYQHFMKLCSGPRKVVCYCNKTQESTTDSKCFGQRSTCQLNTETIKQVPCTVCMARDPSRRLAYFKFPLFFLTFTGPCIANIFSEYNQQDATFLSLFISVIRSACFRRFFRPSSGAQNCTYSVRSDKYPTLCVQFRAPDDGRKNRLKHVERLTEINK